MQAEDTRKRGWSPHPRAQVLVSLERGKALVETKVRTVGQYTYRGSKLSIFLQGSSSSRAPRSTRATPPSRPSPPDVPVRPSPPPHKRRSTPVYSDSEDEGDAEAEAKAKADKEKALVAGYLKDLLSSNLVPVEDPEVSKMISLHPFTYLELSAFHWRANTG